MKKGLTNVACLGHFVARPMMIQEIGINKS